jgi:hypothetical protein
MAQTDFPYPTSASAGPVDLSGRTRTGKWWLLVPLILVLTAFGILAWLFLSDSGALPFDYKPI